MSIFQQLNEAAAAKGLRFIVIGGHAVISHGYQRATEDIDILVDKDDRLHWKVLVEELGYRLGNDGGTFLQFNPTDETHWDLDIMLVPGETFRRLFDEARSVQIEASSVRFPSLEYLLALKIHALRNSTGLRVLKDSDDVAQLLVANQVDPRSDWVRTLFHKHGTLELHERIIKLATP